MKKIYFFTILLLSLFISCKNDSENFISTENFVSRDEFVLQNDLNEFRNNIQELSFAYSEKNNEFYYNLNETKIVINKEDCIFLNDVIFIPYTATYKDASYKGITYKTIEEDSSGILLSFDDYYSTWDKILPRFTEHSIKATWFCKGRYVTDFMKNAQDVGQCIGYHGKNHTMLKYFSPEKYDDYLDKFDWECIHFLSTFINSGIKMYSFAIPHGSGLWYDWQMERLKNNYQIVRDFDPNFHLYSKAEIESGYISSQSIDNNKFLSDEEFKQKITERFLITKMTKKIYSCTSHTFGNSVNDGGGYSLTYKRLEILFKLIKDFKLKTYTFNDFCMEFN